MSDPVIFMDQGRTLHIDRPTHFQGDVLFLGNSKGYISNSSLQQASFCFWFCLRKKKKRILGTQGMETVNIYFFISIDAGIPLLQAVGGICLSFIE